MVSICRLSRDFPSPSDLKRSDSISSAFYRP